MKQFTTLTSKVVPLPIQNVDTDMIIPAQFLTSTSREGYGANLFRRLRDQDPNFPLSLPRYQKCSVLLTEENFGCGSSREHAVWALLDFGIRAIIGVSFADIFAGNAAKNGLLLITLPHKVIRSLFLQAESGDVEVTIHLRDQTVTLPDGTLQHFDYPPFRKHCLLEGKDDFDYLLEARNVVEGHQLKNPVLQFLPDFQSLLTSEEGA